VSSVPSFVALLLVVLAFAGAKGGGPERAVALAYIIASAGSLSLSFFEMPGEFRVVPVHILVTDVLLLAALCVLAIRANRWWVIPTAGCQLVAVLVHTGKLVDPAMIPNGYAFLTTIWSWPRVALLALGTWRHQRRLAQGTIAPDWKPSSRPRQSRMRGEPRRD
jgi:hypothetical protein